MLSLSAQGDLNDDIRKKFEQFKQTASSNYTSFNAKANSEYVEFLKVAWEEFAVQPEIKSRDIDPPVQPIAPPTIQPASPTPKPITPQAPIVVVKPQVEPKPTPTPPSATPAAKDPMVVQMPIKFYGAQCKIRLKVGTGAVYLADTAEKSVAEAWSKLADGRFEHMVTDCINIKKGLRLCDWGFFLLTKSVAEAFYETRTTNHTKLLQAYLMTQAGFKLRLARVEQQLFIMLPSQHIIYGRKYVALQGTNYYFLDDNYPGGAFYLCPAAFPGEEGFSIRMDEQPLLPYEKSDKLQVHQSKRYPHINVSFEANKNLIDFYNTFPISRWDNFSYSSLSNEAKSALYPTLIKAIDGKSEIEAANMLINFVQTGFKYKTDGEQFGYERPLFGDETLYYDYCDCEDRAILYSILIRDLLGLKVALIDYPNHIATAVCFKGVYGDYFDVDGKKYTICDPTYIGATVGMTMPDMDNSQAKIITLQ